MNHVLRDIIVQEHLKYHVPVILILPVELILVLHVIHHFPLILPILLVLAISLVPQTKSLILQIVPAEKYPEVVPKVALSAQMESVLHVPPITAYDTGSV